MSNKLSIGFVFDETYFSEFAESCAKQLESQGVETRLLNNIPDDGDWDAVLVIGIHKFVSIPLFRETLLLGVQTEQLPLDNNSVGRLRRNRSRFCAVSGYYSKIFDWNPSLFEAKKGGAVFIPYGCRIQEVKEVPKQYDLLFIGNVGGSPRRKELLDYLSSRFSFYPDYSPGFGARKDEAIQVSKICLNLHYYEDCGFESPRIFDYLSRKAFVLSEKVSSSYPFTVGKDIDDFAGKEELAEKITYYLEHEEDRNKIAEHGFKTASVFDYERTANILLFEIQKALSNKASTIEKTGSWLKSKVSCEYFSFRDYLSLKRRGGA